MTTTKQTEKGIHRLPMRVAMGWPLRPRGDADQDGGWAVFETDNVEALMSAYPRAEMPCWKRLKSEGLHIFEVR